MCDAEIFISIVVASGPYHWYWYQCCCILNWKLRLRTFREHGSPSPCPLNQVTAWLTSKAEEEEVKSVQCKMVKEDGILQFGCSLKKLLLVLIWYWYQLCHQYYWYLDQSTSEPLLLPEKHRNRNSESSSGPSYSWRDSRGPAVMAVLTELDDICTLKDFLEGNCFFTLNTREFCPFQTGFRSPKLCPSSQTSFMGSL